MWASVAIDASCRVCVSGLDGFSVEAFFVGGLLIGVAGCARNLFWRGHVRCGLYVCVAIHACEHAAVDGTIEFVGIDVEADGLTVYFMG